MNTRTQCLGITIKGIQCKRTIRNGQYCTIHANQAHEHYNPRCSVIRTNHRMNETKEETKEDTTEETEEEMKEETKEVVCKCCCSPVDVSVASYMSCSNRRKQHTVCEDCVQGHVQSNLNQGVATCKCMFDPSEKCGGIYSRTKLLSMLPPETVERFEDALQVCEVSAMSKQIDNFHICPHCSKFGVIVNEKYDKTLQCQHPACGKSWCAKCRQEHAPNKSCLKYTRAFTPESVAAFVSFQISNAILHKCPRCFTSFVKEDEGTNGAGCNAMNCPKCRVHSCYLCNAVLPSHDYYRHFKGNSSPASDRRCVLYNAYGTDAGNKQYHQTRIVNACMAMLLENIDNVQVLREMVYQCIRVHKVLTMKQLPRNIQAICTQQPPPPPQQPRVPFHIRMVEHAVQVHKRVFSMFTRAFQTTH